MDKYEEKRFPMRMPHPVDAIELQMQNLGFSRKDLMAALNKSSGRISDILNCRRALTLSDIRKLSKLLHIPIEVLSEEYPLKELKPRGHPGPIRRTATF